MEQNTESIFMLYYKSKKILYQAAVYSNIGQSKLRELTDNDSCRFVIWVGKKRLIKRKLFDEYIDKQFSI